MIKKTLKGMYENGEQVEWDDAIDIHDGNWEEIDITEPTAYLNGYRLTKDEKVKYDKD